MGQTLSEPVVDKKSENGAGDSLIFGVSSMQGWRISMEDAHAAVLDLQAATEGGKATPPDQRLSFFGVYDGHGGDKVAIYTGENLHKIVAKQEAFKEGDLKKALQDGFLATDRAILSDPKYEEEVSGCTASVGIISNNKIYVANSGDSRTVLGIKGRAKPLSYDHKPQNETEKARIQAAGGFVDFGRVNGNLALSRAIGDFEFKKSAELPPEHQIVTAFPDVEIHDITEDDEFLVIACDGIWDCQSSQAVVEFVRRGIAAKQELSAICENMMDNCLASNSDTGGVGCDNMTMIVIGLLQGRTKEQWYEDIAKRVANGDGPCAPPEYGKSKLSAEFRGPGVHHRADDNSDDIDMDLDHRFRPNNGTGGRIILLGDGTEISAEAADSEMFDHDDEDKDLDAQVRKFGEQKEGSNGNTDRSTREEILESQVNASSRDSPSSVKTEKAGSGESKKASEGTNA
ncbi:protein phosphatase-like protein 2c [Delitschia confertaspora ATCC 74209]|uniref:Protein phosphatase 2C homolog 2 n=1 Tax=Delitschia confertaspora ATCC 74209 TaxID=1513339 RepID=A0A9P4MQA1_9PLEO|nr:protein phosphatase-like protein 2c [Delitschia confertaspora ATCC 74209]